ncbi:MAG: RidA family protein [Aestuariivirgaceae bacterium]|jgi:2-iminobutanoate/2-iminopropanoate deaminase
MAVSYDPKKLWQPFGPFAMAVVQGDGRIVHLKGQVPLDEHGELVGEGDMRAQLRQVLENLKVVLDEAGGGLSDIISLIQYTTDIKAFIAAGDIRRTYFSKPYPVTSTVQVSALYRPEVLVEIAGIAEIPSHRFKMPRQAS